MKKLIWYTLTVASLFIASGCNKKLDVEPRQNITPDQIRNEGDVLAVLFGGYSLYQAYPGFGEQLIFASDLLADGGQIDFVGTFLPYRDLADKSQVASNGIAQTIWNNCYTIINVANTVLDKADLVNEEDREAIIGEAKFLRGLAYFELVNYFAKPYSTGNAATDLGVPLVLEPVYDYQPERDKPSRATVAAVYTQVVADLTAAYGSLPEPGDASNSRADKYSAEAILTRVYMNMGKYVEAATAADDVIANSGRALAPSFADAFNYEGSSGEDLFSIQQTSQSNAGTSNQGIVTFYLSFADADYTGGRGDAQIDPEYLDLFEPGDERGQFHYEGASIAGASGLYPIKWAQFYKAIPVVRLAEMYLTRGEANLRSGGSIGDTPLNDINEVRKRANASELSSVTANDFVEERFRELGFEGDRLWTLKRLKLSVQDNDTPPKTYPYDDNRLVLPIPQTDVDVNTNLVQNPGY